MTTGMFNCDNCDKETRTGHLIRPKSNEEHNYAETIFVCEKCHKKLV